MDAIAITIPSIERGGQTRVMKVRLGELTPFQRETLQWLPTTRDGAMPVLRGPTKASKVQAHLVATSDGLSTVADFSFKVPAQVVEADLPGLLDDWRRNLVKRREQLGAREARRAARAKNASEPKPRPARTKAAQESGVDAAHGLLQEHAPVAAPLDIAHAIRCLPLLRPVEVEGMPGPDALVLHGQVWSAMVKVRRFDAAGFELQRIDHAIDASVGPEWRDSDRVENLDLRVEQVHAEAQESHQELVVVLQARRSRDAEKPAAAESDKPPKGKGRIADVPRVAGTAQLMDLARQIFVDLCTAPHAAQAVLAEPEAYPDWVEMFAKGVVQMASEVSIAHGLQTFDLRVRVDMLEKWCETASGFDVTPQLALWAGEEQRRLQRAIEPQVLRAKQWKRAWSESAEETAAAVALLLLVC